MSWEPLPHPEAYPPPWFADAVGPATSYQPSADAGPAAAAATPDVDASVILHPGERLDEEEWQTETKSGLRWAFYVAPLAVLAITVVAVLWRANLA